MQPPSFFTLVVFFFLFSALDLVHSLPASASLLPNDTAALVQFRSQTDAHGNLRANWTTGNACSASWLGVRCTDGRVTALSLPSLDLRGPIDSLARLDQLRLLDLHGNRLNGSILPVTNFSNLKLLYLARNDFSGVVPAEIGSLKRLLRLDLSDNNLRGPIPTEIRNLTHLLTIRLENNVLAGEVPDLSTALPELRELNLSNNELYGKVPSGLVKKFGLRSIAGNAGLCGMSPLPVCSFTGSPPTAASAQTVVPSNPSSFPAMTAAGPTGKGESRKGLSTGAIVAIVVGNSVALLVITSFVVAYYCGRNSGESGSTISSRDRRRNGSYTGEKKIYANNGGGGGGDSDGTTATDRSKLVFFDRRKQFELEDLLRASAEMLGKGSFGTVYKAILEDGCTVAVKRLKDANPCVRKEFEQYMDLIGNLRHPNLVHLRAYYYAKEEKLLVYDYLSNGSLHSLLHGNG
uniref:Protein kinase domain-containing protein n=1 Tax=Nelumbo nucifera TaxID=4432 RepID=A0A822ZW20_NELNU|nr:TPA_asm: hypothetical protein HUJ06_018627 [Nelumbo nucifera]